WQVLLVGFVDPAFECDLEDRTPRLAHQTRSWVTHTAPPHGIPGAATRRDGCSSRSEALFKPMVGIGLVIKGLHLLVTSASVQRDGFKEGAIGFQMKHCTPRLLRLAFQFLKQAPSQSQATRLWSYPHALDLAGSVDMELDCATAHCLLTQTGDEQ